jgi:hypothetical protein
MRLSCECERLDRVLSKRPILWWCSRASYDRYRVPATANSRRVRESCSSYHCRSQQPSYPSARRLLRNNNNDWARSSASCARTMRNNPFGGGCTRTQSVGRRSERSGVTTTSGIREALPYGMTVSICWRCILYDVMNYEYTCFTQVLDYGITSTTRFKVANPRVKSSVLF